ncbi:Protein mab-21-like 3 [Manis javanica]|nr:Protein mab-21-like 3 [Manis javanica]
MASYEELWDLCKCPQAGPAQGQDAYTEPRPERSRRARPPATERGPARAGLGVRRRGRGSARRCSGPGRARRLRNHHHCWNLTEILASYRGFSLQPQLPSTSWNLGVRWPLSCSHGVRGSRGPEPQL